ncbi:MAG TPA: hypothetical protein VG101_05500, partial [Puia sp.]|nr:hypothetical protein [Puia sp.]
MFAAANKIASCFTLPIVISFRKASGTCGSGIGTCIVINEEGWFITAFHVMQQYLAMLNSVNQYMPIRIKRKEIESNAALKDHEKKKQLNQLKIPSDAIIDLSIWFGVDGWSLGPQVHGIPDIDIAAGQILNFNKDLIKAYPRIKDPTKPMDPGTSLCKLGFPFYEIMPTFAEGTGFSLPPGSVPIPFFPLEGIFTRMVN